MSLNPARACTQSDITLYRHKIVRDLLWSLCAPPLVTASPGHAPWVDDGWFDSLILELLEPLALLDEDPAPLLSDITQGNDRRLGRIFETLLAHAFRISQRFEVLARNVVIEDQERTLGEIDFLLMDTENECTLHLEVAVKFYLCMEQPRGGGVWIGPDPRDRLPEKKQGMERQLELSRSPESQAWLADQGIEIDERLCVMKGRLFHPLNAQPEYGTAEWINPNHLAGWCSGIAGFLDYQQSSDLRWAIVDKSDWLSPLTRNDDIQALSHEQLTRMLAQDGLFDSIFSKPVCIAGLREGQEMERGFLLPERWPHDTESATKMPDFQ